MKVKDIIDNQSEWFKNEQYENNKPLVTIILPTSSCVTNDLLRKSIESVLIQSFRRFELIIVIDDTNIEIVSLCEQYMQRDSRISLICHKNSIGIIAISFYEAFIRARGQYIAYISEECRWMFNALAQTYDFMVENRIKASFGITKSFDLIDNKWIELGRDEEMVKAMLPFKNCIGTCSVILAKEVLDFVGLPDPHISLIDVYEWDLWQRVSNVYDFVATKIEFAIKKSLSWSENLNEVFSANQWFFREHQQKRNLHLLLSENYLSYDITECFVINSVHYIECMIEAYLKFIDKEWFVPKELEDFYNMDGNKNVLRILTVWDRHTASCMSFSRYRGDNYVFSFGNNGSIPYQQLAMSDIIIIGRTLQIQSDILDICYLLKIPLYYYVDDNFREAALDTNEFNVRQMAKLTTKKMLQKFYGVIVSSLELKNYFLNNQLHNNVFLLEPILKYPDLSSKKRQGVLTIGFMGGIFREDVLSTCVIPTIRKVAQNKKVIFVYPCSSNELRKMSKFGLEEHVKIIYVKRTSNYEFLINNYQSIGIDILIHCGRNLRNNLYKTKNALINAVSLGAVLVASDIEPYCIKEKDEPENDYVLVKNDSESWEAALKNLLDAENRKDIVKNAQKYCEDHFNSSKVWEELDKEFSLILNHNNYFYLKRYQQLSNYLASHILDTEQNIYDVRGVRKYVPEELSYTGELKTPRRYGFTTSIECIREIGLLFAMTGECSGNVLIRILRRHNQVLVDEINIDMQHLVKDGYTNFYLDHPLITKKNELLYLVIDFQYEKKEGFIGLFEDKNKRNIIYKIFNKLGYPLPGKNTLFIDCRG